MKRIFTFISLLVIALGMSAQTEPTTTDYMTAENITLDLSKQETVYLTVCLKGETLYSAHSVRIQLPEDVVVAEYEGDWDAYIDANCIYPLNRTGLISSHSLTWEYNQEKNVFSVACISAKSENMRDTNGLLFYVGLEPSRSAIPGTYDIRLYDVCLIDKDANNSFAPETIVKVTIKDQSTGIKNISDDAANQIYTIDGISVANPQKGRLYIVDGKKVKY